MPGDYIASLNAALLSNEAPDVFELQTVDLSRVRAGQLELLDDLFEGVRDDFNETALERVTVDGTLYGVPMILAPQFLYYRESALAEAGLEPPTTMDSLIEAAGAVQGGRGLSASEHRRCYLSNSVLHHGAQCADGGA